ncbi:MAG: ATP-dependent DNA helicase RecG [Candidatus Edwardsbacteria bacterium]|nr:ATP-dependent DNA helicase RecG [Candidatus Edwardsbacteria bacterium]
MTGTVDIQYLKGVGPRRASLLRGMGIASLADLLYTPPRRYVDRSLIKPAGSVRPGEQVTVFGSVADKSVVRARRGFSIFNLLLSDGTGYLLCKWFNQPYLSERFTVGQKLVVSGTVKYDRGPSLVNPEYELIDAEDEQLIHTGRIVPLHAVTAGLTTRQYRVILRNALDEHLAELPETLPAGVRSRHRLLPLAEALSRVHFPESLQQAAQARQRLAFEELFYLQVLIALQRRGAQRDGAARPLADHGWRARFDGLLRFDLTAAQRRVIGEISADLATDRPMHRLLQGDVGSGKTVVALAAILQTVGSGGQAALMAPTELLAEQHFATLAPWFEKLGVPAALLTGSLSAKDRAALHQRIADGRISVCVGTHAVIQEGVRFRELALAVIDEQHRFGVRQRASLRDRRTGGPAGRQPHVLVMTATPIPRTLALTIYGDLDVSVIDELPPGRVPIVTRWTAEGNRDKVYRFLGAQIAAGRPCTATCPATCSRPGAWRWCTGG